MVWDIPRHHKLKAERENLYEVQGGKCNQCGQGFGLRHLNVDHITPVTRGGSQRMDNLQLLCEPCQSRKKDSVV